MGDHNSFKFSGESDSIKALRKEALDFQRYLLWLKFFFKISQPSRLIVFGSCIITTNAILESFSNLKPILERAGQNSKSAK